MTPDNSFSRRSFLATAGAVSMLPTALCASRYPIGLGLYSVRNELQKDLEGTVTAVAKLGYEVVEFFSPYFSWTPQYAKQVRKLLDDLGVKSHSTHNSASSFEPENISKAIELNSILGNKYVVMASAGKVDGPDGWKRVAERLNQAAEKMASAKLRPGFHNHQMEFKGPEGSRPMDILAQNTSKQVLLQLDVGTCVEAGADPVAWIEKNPGRFGVLHLKEYSPQPGIGYLALFGEGASPWKAIFKAAEAVGGVEYYLIEQEASQAPMEAVRTCLANFRKIHG